MSRMFCNIVRWTTEVGAGMVALTAQDRMKIKMQEKAKKKTSEKYTVEQLLEKVTYQLVDLSFKMPKHLIWLSLLFLL